MTSQDQRPSTNRTPSFTGLKPLILAKTSSSSSPRQPSLQSYTNKSRKSNNGVLGYGGNDALGLSSNIQSQRRSVSARQPHNQMSISYQLLPGMESDLGLGFSPSTLQLSFTSPSANNRSRRTRSETFKFPLPPNFNLDNQMLSLTTNRARYQNLDFSSDTSSSRESSPNLRSNHHRRQVVISQSWKNDVQSWINEKSPSDLISGVSWSDVVQEKERIRLHLEAQAQLGGRQGWSPETESSCSFPSQPIGLGFESEEIPSVTAPLFSSKPISLKHRDSQDTVASSIRSWAFSTAAANSDSSDKISLAPPSYSSNSESTNGSQVEKQPQVVTERRRRSNSILPPAYADDESQSQSPEKEAQEYPFPLMDASLNNEDHSEDGDVEDEEKLRRLNESFLLLGQPELEESGDDEEKDAQLPHEGQGNLSPFVNPFTLKFDSNREFTAPSLAEQMAYACGSGMGYLSADEEEKLGWEARGVRSQIKQDQEAQSSEEEDAYIYNEERAEIESSWSAGGEGIQSWDQVESEDEIFWRSSQSPQEMVNHSSNHSSSGRYRLSQGLGRSGALRRNPTSASLRTLSVLSGSSTSSSPILSGVLAAPRPRAVTYGYQGERSPIDIDTLFSRPLSLEIKQGEKFGKEESSQMENLENEEDCLLNDFAYLLDDSVSDFKAPEVEVLKSSMTVPSDLNTIIQPSPALSTPSLNLLQTPEMLSSLPSPLPKGGRKIEGLPSFASCPAFPFQSSSPAPEVEAAEAEEETGIPSSISTASNLSILDRPRPFSRCDLGNDYIQIPKKIKRPTSSLSRNVDSPSNLSVNSASSRLLPSTSSPDIPIRRSSFEERRPEVLVESSSSQGHNSPTAYFEETRKALVNEDAKLKVDLEELVNSRRKSQVQIQVPAASPSVAASASSSSKATSSGRKGLLRNKLSVAALRGLVSSEKETKKPVTSVAMKPSNSSDSNATSSYSVQSNLTSVSKPKSILSSSSSSKTLSSRSSQPVIKGSELDAIKRSCADKTAFIKAAAIRAQYQANYPESIHSSSSRSSASSSSSISTRPSIQSNDSNLSKTSSYSNSSISSSLSLPTLCVARTPSQRQRGETGLPETTRSKFSSDEEILKKKLNVDGKGVTIGLARTKSGRVREVKVEDDRRLPERLKEFKQARRISQVKALVQGNPGEERTLPLPPPPKGILILEESSKEVVQVMVKF